MQLDSGRRIIVLQHRINNKNGFTIIELLIVIVVLGILAAIALPRFADLRDKALVSVIEQTAGALKSTSAIYHAEALVKDVSDGTLMVNGNSFDMRDGYIRGHWNLSWRYALDLSQQIPFTGVGTECSVNDLCGVGNQTTATGLPFSTGGVNGLVLVWPKGYRINQLCYAYYFNPETGAAPTIGSVTSGC